MMVSKKWKTIVLPVIFLFFFFVELFSCIYAQAAESPFIGTWGAAILQYENAPHYWYVESTRITFNSDGTGSMVGWKNDQYTDLGEEVKQIPDTSFTYSVTDNGDGSHIVSMIIGGETFTRRGVISDNGNMMLMDGTYDPAWVKCVALVKIDTGKTYSRQDFNGDYVALGYEHTTGTATDPPDGNGTYMAISSIESFDSTAGTYNYKGRANSIKNDGSIMVWDDEGFDVAAPYDVLSDGWVWIQEGAFRGHLAGSGGIGVGGGSFYSEDPNTRAAYFLMKKNDRAASGGYETSDLAGTWVVSDFGDVKDDEAQIISAGFGVMNCDSTGKCVLAYDEQVNGSTFPGFNEFQFSVSSDGSLGTAPGSLYNIPYGAIGNDGNTVLFNPGLAFSDQGTRRIVVGIKASSASDITQQRIFAESVHDTIEGSAYYYGSFFVLDPLHSLSGVNVTGPDITGELNLVYREETGEWWTVSRINYGETIPANKIYTIALTSSTGGQMSVSKTINGGVENFATPVSPLGRTRGDITFVFQGVVGADHYRISVGEGSDPTAGGEIKWISDPIYSDQESISVGYGGSSLSPGKYNYGIHTFIDGNSSISRSTFTITPNFMPWMPILLEE